MKATKANLLEFFRKSPHFFVAALCLFLPVRLWALEPEEIWERVSPSVVRIESTLLNGEQKQGSGFICEIEGKKYILSNRHVVLGAKEVRVGISVKHLVFAPTYRISPELDLALIEVPKEVRAPALKKRISELRTGERLYAVGFPLGLNKAITQGLLSSQTEKILQFDAPISSGSSGGPLVDKEGLVIGIVTAASTSSANQIAQNLNFAIKTTVIPKLELFRDPIISFYDAWRELVGAESALIDGLKDQSVFEVCDYLQRELAAAVYQADAKLSPDPVREFNELQADCLRELVQKHGTIEKAAGAASTYLKMQIPKFDKLSELFGGLGKQELLKEFTRDQRPGGLFRLQVDESEIPSLLKISLEHVKAKYEDTAYQIEFLAGVLPKLRGKDSAFIKQCHELNAKIVEIQRDSIHLRYELIGKSPSDAERLLWFGKSLLPYNSGNSDPSILTRRVKRQLSAKEEFTYFGGFETDIASMFQRLAIAQLQSNHLDKAIGYLRNDVSLRKFGGYRMLAHFTAGSGDFETAFRLYERAFNASEGEFNPFTLKFGGNSIRSLIADEIADDGDRFWSYPTQVRKNLTAWHAFVIGKEAMGLVNLPTLQEALAAKPFRAATEFEQYLVLHSFQSKALSTGFEKFLSTIRSDAVASKLYKKFF